MLYFNPTRFVRFHNVVGVGADQRSRPLALTKRIVGSGDENASVAIKSDVKDMRRNRSSVEIIVEKLMFALYILECGQNFSCL